MNDHFEKVARFWIEDSLGSGHPVRKLVESLDAEIAKLKEEIKWRKGVNDIHADALRATERGEK